MTREPDAPSRRDMIRSAAAGGLAVALVPGGLTVASGVARAAAGPSKVMIIRHAEKPAADGEAPYGLDAEGRHDTAGLLVEGWQRAGALVGLFAPHDGRPRDPALARPTFLFAAAASAEHKSLRSMLTLRPLAAATGIAPVETFGPDHEAAAAAAILARPGIGLVAWEHKRIADLVTALTGGGVMPPHWSGKRFDMVLVLDRDPGGWRLTQVPQLLLAGDSAEPLRMAKAAKTDD